MARYEKRAPLSNEARAAFLALPYKLKSYNRHMHLVSEGERSDSAQLILDGLVYRHKVTADGRRQILSVHMRGDFIDLDASLLGVADHNVQALEQCIVAEVPRAALADLIARHGTVAHAMWIDTLIDGSVYREWVLNVGARDSRKAMCHLLCEIGRRLEFVGLADKGHFRLPMTQEQLADCLGITAVHTNRTLRDLDKAGVLIRRDRFIEVPDWAKLAEMAGFNETYLHLDLMVAARN